MRRCIADCSAIAGLCATVATEQSSDHTSSSARSLPLRRLVQSRRDPSSQSAFCRGASSKTARGVRRSWFRTDNAVGRRRVGGLVHDVHRPLPFGRLGAQTRASAEWPTRRLTFGQYWTLCQDSSFTLIVSQQSFSKRPEAARRGFDSFHNRVTPRGLRYNLLLGQMLNTLPEDDPDRDFLQEAMAVLKQQALVADRDIEATRSQVALRDIHHGLQLKAGENLVSLATPRWNRSRS